MNKQDEIIEKKLEEILEDFGCFIPDGPPNPQQAAICASLTSLVKGYGKEVFTAAIEEVRKWVKENAYPNELADDDIGMIDELQLKQFLDSLTEEKK